MAKKIKVIQRDPTRGIYGTEDTPFIGQDIGDRGLMSLLPAWAAMLGVAPAVTLKPGARGYPPSAADFLAGDIGEHPPATAYPAAAAPPPAYGLQPSAVDFVSGNMGQRPPATPYYPTYDSLPPDRPMPDQPPASIEDYYGYPAVDRPMTAATREQRQAVRDPSYPNLVRPGGPPGGFPASLPPDRPMPGRTGTAYPVSSAETVQPEHLTEDWQVPTNPSSLSQQPLEPTQAAYPLPPEGTVVGQEVAPPPAQSAIDFLSGALGKPPPQPKQPIPLDRGPDMPVDQAMTMLETGAPNGGSADKLPGLGQGVGVPPGPQYRLDALGNVRSADEPGPVEVAMDAARNWRKYVAQMLEQSSATTKDDPKPDDKTPKEAKPGDTTKPGNVTSGGVTVTRGGGVIVDTGKIGAQVQAGSNLKDVQSMIDTLFPPLDQSNPKQDVADANAQRQMQRDALLAQMALGAGIASGAGRSWEGIARGGMAAAGMFDEGFKRYQAALQDSADRYAEANKTNQAYDTAKRSAVVSLLSKGADDQREERKLAFDMYKEKRAEAMDLFKPWLSVLEKSDPLMGGPDLQAQQAAIANGINHYLSTGEFVEPHWQTGAPA